MNKVWNELLEFETRDLVNRFIKKRYGKKLNTNRILQITSNFIQGREYIKSSKKSSISVRPLLQYYGVMALSKGLILSLDLMKKEENLKPSHGLNIKNWNNVLKNKDFENLEISIGNGTFSELLKATENKNYLRANSSEINYESQLKSPTINNCITLKQLIQYFPDLSKEYYSWIEEKLHFAIVDEIKVDVKNNKIKIKLVGKIDQKTINLLFPQEYCPTKSVKIIMNSTTIEYNRCDWFPNITQRWHGAFNIGDACIIPTLPNDIGLNLLSGMYITSYVFGMMARYYPSAWISLRRIEKGDKIYPFVFRVLDYIDEKFPRQILDFLNSPYDFEGK